MTEKIDTLKAESTDLVRLANEIKVTNDAQLEIANGLAHNIKAMISKIKEDCRPSINKAREAWQESLKLEKRHLAPLEKAKDLVTNGLIAPYLAERRRKQYEAEQAAIAAKVEAIRKAEKEERERLATAKAAIEEGEIKEAEEILEKPVEEKPELIFEMPKPPPKLKGSYERTDWLWECTNIDIVPRPLLMLNRPDITARVNRLKDKADIPGIRVFSKTTVVTRG